MHFFMFLPHCMAFIYWVAYIFGQKVTTQLFKDNYKIIKIKQNVELCAIYWHFLLIVWFVLFGLMVAT